MAGEEAPTTRRARLRGGAAIFVLSFQTGGFRLLAVALSPSRTRLCNWPRGMQLQTLWGPENWTDVEA